MRITDFFKNNYGKLLFFSNNLLLLLAGIFFLKIQDDGKTLAETDDEADEAKILLTKELLDSQKAIIESREAKLEALSPALEKTETIQVIKKVPVVVTEQKTIKKASSSSGSSGGSSKTTTRSS